MARRILGLDGRQLVIEAGDPLVANSGRDRRGGRRGGLERRISRPVFLSLEGVGGGVGYGRVVGAMVGGPVDRGAVLPELREGFEEGAPVGLGRRVRGPPARAG